MSILNTYKPLLDINPAKKTLLDQSGNGYVITPSGKLVWESDEKRSTLSCRDSGVLAITTDASLNDSTALTILIFGKIPKTLTGSNIHIFNKNLDFELYSTAADGNMRFWAASGDASSGVDIRGANMIGVSHQNGSTPTFYKNGAYASSGTVITRNLGAANVYFGNYGPGASPSYVFQGKNHRILYFDQILSGETISKIYDEVMAEISAGDTKTMNYKAFMPPIDTNCVLAYDMQSIAGGKIVDLSGNGKDITFTQGSAVRTRSHFPAMKFGASAAATFTSTSLGTTHTLEFIADEWNTNVMFLCHNADTYSFYYDSTAVYYSNDNVTYVSWTGLSLVTGEHHIIIDRNGTSVTLYIDGVSQGTKTPADNEALTVSKFLLSNYPFFGKRGYTQVYSDSKGATWAKNRYLKYAQKVIYDGRLKNAPPSLANIPSGALFQGTEAVSQGASLKLVEKANGLKYIVDLAAGNFYRKQPFAYGTFYFRYNKSSAVSACYEFFISTETSYSGALNGYTTVFNADGSLQLLIYPGGGNLMTTAAGYLTNNVDYEFCISRRKSDGEFTFYVRGGVYTSWTKVVPTSGSNPVSNNTYTTSKYLCSYVTGDAGTYHGDLVVFMDVLDPTKGELPNIS